MPVRYQMSISGSQKGNWIRSSTLICSAAGSVHRDLCLINHVDGPRAAVCRGEGIRLARIAQLLLIVAPLIRNPDEYPYGIGKL